MLLLIMNTSQILETIRTWSAGRFPSAAGEIHISEKSAPPPFVDSGLGLPNQHQAVFGVFFSLQAQPTKSLQVWISPDSGRSAYCFVDEGDSVDVISFPPFSSSEELVEKLSEVTDLFMRTRIFEPMLDEWVSEKGGTYGFEELAEFGGTAAYENISPKDWTFFKYTWPDSENMAVVAGFNGSGTVATFYESEDESEGFWDFDERIRGIQNATELRSWLDAVVGRPATMPVSSIAVAKLFGSLTYEIPLNRISSSTIIHAPNGCGKTTILNLVCALLSCRFGDLCQIRFDCLTLQFQDGKRLVVEQVRAVTDPEVAEAEERRRKRLATGPRSLRLVPARPARVQALAVKLFDHEERLLNEDLIAVEPTNNLSPIRTRQLVLRIARRSPHLRAQRHGVLDSNTGEFLTFGEVLERHAAPETGEALSWLKKLLARNAVRLIGTSRLDAEMLINEEGPMGREEFATIPAVSKDAKEVAELLGKLLKNFSDISQKLDREFPQQLIDTLKRETSGVHQKALEEIEEKYARLVSAGILDQSEAHGLRAISESDAQNPIVRSVLGIYASNQRKKLEVFDDLLGKIEVLKDIINERFEMKRLTISPEHGYVVESKSGDETLIPLDRLSSGEQHQLVLFHSLIFGMRPGALIMIDEPEISLHVAWQQVFLADLDRISQETGIHFLIATHSPQIIDDRWEQTVDLAEQLEREKSQNASANA